MRARKSAWRVHLADAADNDFAEILRWTLEQLGERQMRIYGETLTVALEELAAGPTIVGAVARDDIGRGISTLHVARRGRKGRHFVMFRVDREHNVIEVLRLLHDAMDLSRHVPPSDEREE